MKTQRANGERKRIMQFELNISHHLDQSQWTQNIILYFIWLLAPPSMKKKVYIENKIIYIKNRDRPGGLVFLSCLPGLDEGSAWPAASRPGLKIMACACHRQAGPGRQAGLVAWLMLWFQLWMESLQNCIKLMPLELIVQD